SADKSKLPIRRRTLEVMPLQRFLIVGTLIAKDCSASVQLRAGQDQSIPKIMSDFMAEVAQERAVGFFLERALLFALDVVRFGNVDGDQSVIVSGQYALGIAIGGILQKLKRQPGIAVTALRNDRQPESEQSVYHAALGELQSEPRCGVAQGGKIRNDPIQATRSTKRPRLIGWHRPVAHAGLVIVPAQSIGPIFRRS